MSSPVENLVTSCPQCNSLVGLPSIMSLDATVRCPVCQHKYTLRAQLPQQIPQLELVVEQDDVVDERGAATLAVDPLAKLEVNEILRRNAKLSGRRQSRRSRRDRNRPPREARSPGAFSAAAQAVPEEGEQTPNYSEFQAVEHFSAATVRGKGGPASVGQAADGKGAARSYGADLRTAGDVVTLERQVARRGSVRRRSSRQKSQVVEFAKVALGALLALPVAQLIIWWMLAVDPLQLAPGVAKVLPFAVPGKLLEADGNN